MMMTISLFGKYLMFILHISGTFVVLICKFLDCVIGF